MDFSTFSAFMYNGLVNYTFGDPLIAGAVIIIFIMMMEWKMGMSSDVMMASLPILLIGLGTAIISIDVSGYFTGAIALIIGMILGVAVWKVIGR
jgi:hypothetical protein